MTDAMGDKNQAETAASASVPQHMARVGQKGPAAPAIYLIDDPECPFDLDVVAPYLDCTIVQVQVGDWNASLTPWPEPALASDQEDFAGNGPHTLAALMGAWMPVIEAEAGIEPAARGIAGYSLAGLFALYAFACERAFSCVGSASGSLWYDDWCESLRGDLPARGDGYAYLTLGSKERHAANPYLRGVQRATQETADLLRERGVEVDFRLTTGGHFQYVDERMSATLAHLDDWMTRNA